MADVRTTVSFQRDIYEALSARYRELGFSRVGDLVNAAVRDYLHQRRLEEKHGLMARAATNPSYRRLLERVSEECEQTDAEGVPEY